MKQKLWIFNSRELQDARKFLSSLIPTPPTKHKVIICLHMRGVKDCIFIFAKQFVPLFYFGCDPLLRHLGSLWHFHFHGTNSKLAKLERDIFAVPLGMEMIWEEDEGNQIGGEERWGWPPQDLRGRYHSRSRHSEGNPPWNSRNQGLYIYFLKALLLSFISLSLSCLFCK